MAGLNYDSYYPSCKHRPTQLPFPSPFSTRARRSNALYLFNIVKPVLDKSFVCFYTSMYLLYRSLITPLYLQLVVIINIANVHYSLGSLIIELEFCRVICLFIDTRYDYLQ